MSFTTEERAVIQAVLRYEFHGILHFEIRYIKDGETGTVRAERIASHVIYENPQAGDAIVIERLMGMIHKVRKA